MQNFIEDLRSITSKFDSKEFMKKPLNEMLYKFNDSSSKDRNQRENITKKQIDKTYAIERKIRNKSVSPLRGKVSKVIRVIKLILFLVGERSEDTSQIVHVDKGTKKVK